MAFPSLFCMRSPSSASQSLIYDPHTMSPLKTSQPFHAYLTGVYGPPHLIKPCIFAYVSNTSTQSPFNLLLIHVLFINSSQVSTVPPHPMEPLPLTTHPQVRACFFLSRLCYLDSQMRRFTACVSVFLWVAGISFIHCFCICSLKQPSIPMHSHTHSL